MSEIYNKEEDARTCATARKRIYFMRAGRVAGEALLCQQASAHAGTSLQVGSVEATGERPILIVGVAGEIEAVGSNSTRAASVRPDNQNWYATRSVPMAIPRPDSAHTKGGAPRFLRRLLARDLVMASVLFDASTPSLLPHFAGRQA